MTLRMTGALLLGIAASALAQADPRDAQPERPTVATHAGTVAPGYIEIETGAQFDRVAPHSYAFTMPNVFKFGVISRSQLEIMAPALRPSGGNAGVGDVAAAFKWRIADVTPLGRIALQPALKLSTGDLASGTGTGTTDVALLLIASKSLGPVEMDLNAGYTRRSGNGDAVPRNATLWTASFGGPAVGAVGWVAEMFGYPATSGAAGQSATAAVLAGPTFMARPWLVFDAGVIVPITGWLPHSGYVGLTWNAGRL
jgi:hypothetical protein